MHRMTVDFSAPDEDPCWNATFFFSDLEEALEAICPAAELVVDTNSADGAPSTGHVELDFGTICASKYCDHRAGCNLLIELLRRPIDANEILPNTLIKQNDVNQFTPTSPMKVEWKPPYYIRCSGLEWPWEDCRPPECVGCYKGPQPLAAILAHELIHAWHHQIGEYCYSGIKGWEAPEEICTVQAENQIRWEMAEPARCSYAGHCIVFPIPGPDLTWQVPEADCTKGANSGKYDCILLDPNADKANCGCRPFRPNLWDLVKRRFYCWLTRAFPSFFKDQPQERFIPMDWRERSGFDAMYRDHLDPLPADSRRHEMEGLTEFLMQRRNRLVGESLEESFAEARDAFILETVSVHGAYTLVSCFSTPEGERFITNLRRPFTGREPPPTSGSELTDVVLDGGGGRSARGVLGRNAVAGIPEGIGGVFGLVDGGAEFLQWKSGGAARAMATRDLRSAVAPEAGGDRRNGYADDLLRWAGVRAILEWGRETRAEL